MNQCYGNRLDLGKGRQVWRFYFFSLIHFAFVPSILSTLYYFIFLRTLSLSLSPLFLFIIIIILIIKKHQPNGDSEKEEIGGLA
jgi:hypothetical protein